MTYRENIDNAARIVERLSPKMRKRTWDYYVQAIGEDQNFNQTWIETNKAAWSKSTPEQNEARLIGLMASAVYDDIADFPEWLDEIWGTA